MKIKPVSLSSGLQFAVLTGFLCVVFLIGGGSRHDIVSLAVLRPLSFLVLVAGLLTVTRGQVQRYKPLFYGAIVLAASVAIYLVPVPPGVWQGLASHALIVDAEKAAGLVSRWRPLSVDPLSTWNALFSLGVPLAVLALGVQLTREQHIRLLYGLVVVGLISGAIGLAQVAGDPDGPLYFYRITNRGASVGLFSNRNHQAIFLAALLPVLAFLIGFRPRTARERRKRTAIAASIGLFFLLCILSTASRTGFLLGAIAAAISCLGYFSAPAKEAGALPGILTRHRSKIVAIGGLALVAVGYIVTRTEVFARLANSDGKQEIRLQFWGPVVSMIQDYFPLGVGAGAFVSGFLIREPDSLLGTTYVNHAHNDVLEVLATQGVIGLALLAGGLVLAARRFAAVAMRDDQGSEGTFLRRLGMGVVVMFALASLVDYPLRTPSLMAFFTLGLLWLWEPKKLRS